MQGENKKHISEVQVQNFIPIVTGFWKFVYASCSDSKIRLGAWQIFATLIAWALKRSVHSSMQAMAKRPVSLAFVRFVRSDKMKFMPSHSEMETLA